MITLFRKIRQRLLSEGKTGKPALPAGRYFKYAIGEIALVMIGILLALQVNNWNEKNLQAKNFDLILDALENELIENIEEANFEIPLFRASLLKMDKILSNEVTKNDFMMDSGLRNLIREDKFDFNLDDINALVKNQENFPEKFKVLIPSLKKILKIERRHNIFETQYQKQYSNYTQFLITNQSWYGKISNERIDSLQLKEEVEFYLNNFSYKNYLKAYKWNMSDLVREGISIKNACLTILAEIKRIRENYKKDEIVKLFTKYNMLPFKEKTCNHPKNNDEYERQVHLPFYNSTNREIELKWQNYDNNVVSILKLKPGELMVNAAKNRIREKVVVELLVEGNCIKKYEGIENGFILIE
ncbi:hypothetical protein ACFSQJ_13975 [Croceitalea marina]|uniref:Uncharacterized protein n=1 Tax=Croceitalea marina TaxID=1775166 RepID=A0ABW5MZQ8_9FLAO